MACLPPLGVHHFLADGAGQPVGGVVFAEIVADAAGDDGVIQVFQGVAAVVLASRSRLISAIMPSRAWGPASCRTASNSQAAKPFSRARRNDGLRLGAVCSVSGRMVSANGAGGYYQHGMAGEQIALAVGARFGGRDVGALATNPATRPVLRRRPAKPQRATSSASDPGRAAPVFPPIPGYRSTGGANLAVRVMKS